MTNAQVFLKRDRALASQRNQSFLVSLSENARGFLFQPYGVDVESDQLAHPHTGTVKGLEYSAVAYSQYLVILSCIVWCLDDFEGVNL